MTITWLERAQWGANPASVQLGLAAPHAQFRRLVVHHTVIPFSGDPVAYMQRLQVCRPDLGLEVPYSFVVMPGATPDDAVIGVGRGWSRTGAHTIGYNSTAYGVAFAGDFTEAAPTPGMFAAVRVIGSYLAGEPEPTLGHRDTYSTACPGAATYPRMGELQPPFYLASELAPASIKEEPDMQLTDKTTAGHTVNDLLEWTIDGINRINARLDVLEARVAPGQGGTGPSADAIIDKLKERL